MKRKLVIFAMAGLLAMTACGKKNVSDYVEPTPVAEESEKESPVENAEIPEVSTETDEKLTEESDNKKEQATAHSLYTGLSKREKSVTLDYSMDYEKTVSGSNGSECDFDVTSVKVTAKDTEVGEKIQRIIENHSMSVIDNGDSYYDDFQKKFNLITGEETEIYLMYYDYPSQYENDRVLSVVERLACYGRGADDDIREAMNFDVLTGEELSIEDITSDEDMFLDTAVNDLVAQLSGNAFSDCLAESGDSLRKEIESQIVRDGSWYFVTDGIRFIINSGTITHTDSGIKFVTIPYARLSGLKDEYIFDEVYMESAAIGNDLTADLDNNGSKDVITYDVSGTDSTDMEITLLINGVDYSQVFEDAYPSDGIFLDDYYVVDLDDSDEFVELALMDVGLSADPVTFFFRYDESGLFYFGCIYCLISDSSFEANGDGVIYADEIMRLFETVPVNAEYSVNQSGIHFMTDGFYGIKESNYNNNDNLHEILREVTVHKECSLESDTLILNPDMGKVKFPATDNENWIVIESEDGTYYYLYMTDYEHTEDGTAATEVFGNILLAG